MIQELVEKLRMVNILESDFDDIFKPIDKDEFIEKKLKRCTKNSDGTYSCKGDVNLTGLVLKEIPVKFKKVDGSFNCSSNRLTSLEGCPEYVGRNFSCSNNNLETLEGVPKHVGKGFGCARNKLKTLEGVPKKVNGYFDCSENKLKTLEGAPNIVTGSFDCSYNELVSLKGAPTYIARYLFCNNNPKTKRELAKTIERDYL